MTNNTNYLNNTLLGALNQIKNKQGIVANTTSNVLLGSVEMSVAVSATKTIFPSTVTHPTPATDGGTFFLVSGLMNYKPVVYLNGTKLIENTDYVLTPTGNGNGRITRTYTLGEDYIVLLCGK